MDKNPTKHLSVRKKNFKRHETYKIVKCAIFVKKKNKNK